MSDNSDPSQHQASERQFIAHVERLLSDDRLRIDTTRGRRSAVTLFRDVSVADRGVELKRLMSEMGKPDRALESTMPVGKWIDVTLSQKKWWVFKSPVGQLKVVSVSPLRALLAGETPSSMTGADVNKLISEAAPGPRAVPTTVVIMSTSGFTADARESADRSKDLTLILAAPNQSGGWTVTGSPQTKAVTDLFDPEAEAQKRSRIREEIESSRVDLLSGGIAVDKIVAATKLPLQLVEAELKSYAKETPGLAAKRLDGRVVLFQDGAAASSASGRSAGRFSGGIDMPFMERFKTLFARKGEIEKKVAFLSERRAALSQQRDRSYEDMGTLEAREGEFRQQFKDATGDLTRRRITSQLVQLRKDIERRQQLLSVLNQQINVVSTHLHNLQLQQQGKAANLPDSEEMASDAAAAENVLAELQANNELADSVGSGPGVSMSDEEQALYDELLAEQKRDAPAAEDSKGSQAARTPEAARPDVARPVAAKPAQSPLAANPPAAPAAPPRQRNDPEPG